MWRLWLITACTFALTTVLVYSTAPGNYRHEKPGTRFLLSCGWGAMGAGMMFFGLLRTFWR